MTYSSFSETIKWDVSETHIGRAGVRRIQELEEHAVDGGGPVSLGYSSLLWLMNRIGCASITFTCKKDAYHNMPNRAYIFGVLNAPATPEYTIPFEDLVKAETKHPTMKIFRVGVSPDGLRVIVAFRVHIGDDVELTL